jgi:hypothetical protein
VSNTGEVGMISVFQEIDEPSNTLCHKVTVLPDVLEHALFGGWHLKIDHVVQNELHERLSADYEDGVYAVAYGASRLGQGRSEGDRA